MNNKISTALLVGSLALGNSNVLAQDKADKERGNTGVETTLTDTRTKATIVVEEGIPFNLENNFSGSVKVLFNTNPWADLPEDERQKIKSVFRKEVGHELTEEELEKLTTLLQKPEIKDGLYSIVNKDKTWTVGKFVLALLLGIGYGYAYLVQIIGQLREGKRINVKSFQTFGSISGMMVALNGLIPGSAVYLESCILAFFSVAIDKRNEKQGVVGENNLIPLELFAEHIPFPVSGYDKEGCVQLWNHMMEEETEFSRQDIFDHYQQEKKHLPREEWLFITMRLLYRGENLKKAEEYVRMKQQTGKGYEGITFTMTTKSGKEKTFSWYTHPDERDGDTRLAMRLTDPNEIQAALARTEELVQRDELTGAYRRRVLDENLQSLLKNQKRHNANHGIAFFGLGQFQENKRHTRTPVRRYDIATLHPVR